MSPRRACLAALLLLAACASGFSTQLRPSAGRRRTPVLRAAAEAGYLTPALEEIVATLSRLDDKTRYKQLLYLAAKAPALDEADKVAGNKVPGCLSVVHVRAAIDASTGLVSFQGDSDAQLTKGLVALLVSGLTGHTADEIERVEVRGAPLGRGALVLALRSPRVFSLSLSLSRSRGSSAAPASSSRCRPAGTTASSTCSRP